MEILDTKLTLYVGSLARSASRPQTFRTNHTQASYAPQFKFGETEKPYETVLREPMYTHGHGPGHVPTSFAPAPEYVRPSNVRHGYPAQERVSRKTEKIYSPVYGTMGARPRSPALFSDEEELHASRTSSRRGEKLYLK